MSNPHVLFLVASTREAGHIGNTEWLARRAAQALPATTTQTWLRLSGFRIPPFVDVRHTGGSYALPTGDLRTLLDATLLATDIVFVAPVYWYSLPAPLKAYLDHWSAWIRVPGIDFKAKMGEKSLYVVATSADREKAQPMIDSVRLCAGFLSMRWGGALWGRGGTPGTVEDDTHACAAANSFLTPPEPR